MASIWKRLFGRNPKQKWLALLEPQPLADVRTWLPLFVTICSGCQVRYSVYHGTYEFIDYDCQNQIKADLKLRCEKECRAHTPMIEGRVRCTHR
jgi:hypothetical protein